MLLESKYEVFSADQVSLDIIEALHTLDFLHGFSTVFFKALKLSLCQYVLLLTRKVKLINVSPVYQLCKLFDIPYLGQYQ